MASCRTAARRIFAMRHTGRRTSTRGHGERAARARRRPRALADTVKEMLPRLVDDTPDPPSARRSRQGVVPDTGPRGPGCTPGTPVEPAAPLAVPAAVPGAPAGGRLPVPLLPSEPGATPVGSPPLAPIAPTRRGRRATSYRHRYPASFPRLGRCSCRSPHRPSCRRRLQLPYRCHHRSRYRSRLARRRSEPRQRRRPVPPPGRPVQTRRSHPATHTPR